MENLFCDKNISNKFDLKGSDRNRLVDPSNQNGEIVLLDENLIQSNKLFIIIFRKISLIIFFIFSVLVKTIIYINTQ